MTCSGRLCSGQVSGCDSAHDRYPPAGCETKDDVLKINKQLDAAGIANKHAALGQAAGNAFYNISPFPLRDLRARAPFWLAKALENQIQVAKRQPDFDLLEVPQVVGLSNKL
jgi:hypothetical protein